MTFLAQIDRGYLDAGRPALIPRFMANRKKVSGVVTEEQRHTERLNLRLSPEAMTLLYSLATEVGEGDPKKHLAKTIEQALYALSREMDAEVVGDCKHEPDSVNSDARCVYCGKRLALRAILNKAEP